MADEYNSYLLQNNIDISFLDYIETVATKIHKIPVNLYTVIQSINNSEIDNEKYPHTLLVAAGVLDDDLNTIDDIIHEYEITDYIYANNVYYFGKEGIEDVLYYMSSKYIEYQENYCEWEFSYSVYKYSYERNRCNTIKTLTTNLDKVDKYIIRIHRAMKEVFIKKVNAIEINSFKKVLRYNIKMLNKTYNHITELFNAFDFINKDEGIKNMIDILANKVDLINDEYKYRLQKSDNIIKVT